MRTAWTAALEACGIAATAGPQTLAVGMDRAGRGVGELPGEDATREPPDRSRRRLEPVVRLAPAKVNLTLAVLGTRPDGYHACTA